MIRINKKSIDRIFWSLYVFILIFYPPVIKHSNIALSLISIMILAMRYNNSVSRILNDSGMYLWMKSFVILFLYVCLIPLPISFLLDDIVNFAHYVSLFNRFAVLVVTLVPCCVLILCKMKSKNYDYHFFLEVFVGAGLIESLTAIVAFLSPTIKTFFIALMRQNGDSSLYSNNWYITVRSYGFAGTLVDLFGFGIAIIAGISFFYGITEKRRYIFYSFIIIIASFLNARTGVLIYVIAVVVSVLFLIAKGHYLKGIRAVIGIGVVIIAFMLVINIIDSNSATMQWIIQGYDSIADFFRQGGVAEEETALGKLFTNNFWEMPDLFRTIIGTAHSKYAAQGYTHSDVGYINDIWFSGVLGCCLLYGTLVKFTVEVYRNTTNMVFKFSALYVLIAFGVFNIKGSAIGYNPGASAMFTVLLVINYLEKQSNKIS